MLFFIVMALNIVLFSIISCLIILSLFVVLTSLYLVLLIGLKILIYLFDMELMYFNEEEFLKCNPPCHLSQMDEDFMHRIDLCRLHAGIPFIINSAYRSVDYELSKKRSGKSIHTQGKALDIRCVTNADRYRILSVLIDAGFRRIGIGSNFIHVDAGYPNVTDPLIWLY